MGGYLFRKPIFFCFPKNMRLLFFIFCGPFFAFPRSPNSKNCIKLGYSRSCNSWLWVGTYFKTLTSFCFPKNIRPLFSTWTIFRVSTIAPFKNLHEACFITIDVVTAGHDILSSSSCLFFITLQVRKNIFRTYTG